MSSSSHGMMSPHPVSALSASLSGQRVLVTGGAGFLGSHLVHRLVREGACVSVLDRSMSPHGLNRLADVSGMVEGWQADLEDRGRLESILQHVKPQYVFHLAGRVDLARTAEMTEACVRENISATANLCWALHELAIRALVLTSTTDVYGNNPVPFHEAQRVDPPSPYAISKVAAEQLCRLFGRANGSAAVILRLSPVYGPYQAEARLIPSTILAILQGRRLDVTSCEQRRDFVYVDDAVEGMLRAATAPLAHGETINLGHEQPVSLREVIETIRRLMNTSWQPSYGQIPRRVGEPPVYSCSRDKAKRLLDWEPTTSLEEGLRATIEAYRSLVQRRECSGTELHVVSR